jgi:hypothetical protein
VQDYYLSPGYPMREPRFVSLMQHGKETSHLRLSPFRAAVETLMAGQPPRADATAPRPEPSEPYRNWGFPKASTTDSLLQLAARYVFQAMWHEDQEPGILAAEHFGLPHFRQAIELLYFCLSGDLTTLRSFLTDPLYRFFEAIYPQPALHAFLHLLPALDGIAINALTEERARKLYHTLMMAFRRFLATTVTWGLRSEPVPLNKLLFANLSRLDLIAEALAPLEPVKAACAALEQTSEHIIALILSTRPHGSTR